MPYISIVILCMKRFCSFFKGNDVLKCWITKYIILTFKN